MRTYCTATDPPHEVEVKPRRGGHGISYDPRDLICEEHETPLKTKGELKPRKALRRVSERREGEVRRRGSTLKSGRGLAASPAQQKKVRNLPCIVTGQDRHEVTITAMHLWDRPLGGCDDPLCVVPASLSPHRAYDEHKLDILPHLISGGYFAEMAHVIEAHHVSPTQLLERLTGTRWVPVGKAA